ncbi:hypothetical protein BHE74_00032332 [Ensete ventricosum]|nr:hypothetical protein BHE74_00032332 [Ensete ventricosum]RZS06785.1 hypothetical protein BHM03_00037509 [Ensete ventricosum]
MATTAGGGGSTDDNLIGASYAGTMSIYCRRAMLTTSAGVWLGDNPFRFSLTLLLYQLITIFGASSLIHVVLSRLGQPIAISQILTQAGVLLGPSFLGRNLWFAGRFFARQSFEQLNTVYALSLVIFYFVVGVKADLSLIHKVGKKAVVIAVLGTLLPYISVFLMATALQHKMPPPLTETPVLIILSDRWCLTSYAVVSIVLRELNLLTSKLGRLAMSAALIADIIHLFAEACVGTFLVSEKEGDPMKGLLALLSFLGLVGIIMLVMRPLVLWLIRRTPDGALLSEASFVSVLLMALACGLMSEIIGVDFMAGPFFFGLVLPGGAPLGTTLVERVDRFVTGVLLPVCLVVGGMRTNLASLADATQWGWFEMFVVLCVVSKFLGVVLPCICSDMPHRDAVSLGLMMSSKGIYEVGTAIRWKETQIVDDQLYTTLILSIVIFGGGTAPLVKYLYRPEDCYVAYKRRTLQHAMPDDELRILACVHEQENVVPVLALLDASGPSPMAPICVYLLHLIQLVGRADAVLHPHRRHKKSSAVPVVFSESDHIVNAFQSFEKQHRDGISIIPYICISPYSTMHDDVCSLAHDKKVTLVIVPFHKHFGADGSTSSASSAVQAVNLNVLRYAPCSVGILVDNGLSDAGSLVHRVAVYFLGGTDDREALAYGARMAEHANVELTVVRFLPPKEWREQGREEIIDDRMLMQFLRDRVDGERVVYREEVVKDGEKTMEVIRETSPQFSLLIVGRRAGKESPLTAAMSMWSEYPELGVIGDLLASTDLGSRASTLVVQQQARVMGAMGRSAHSPVSTPKKKRVVLRHDFDVGC